MLAADCSRFHIGGDAYGDTRQHVDEIRRVVIDRVAVVVVERTPDHHRETHLRHPRSPDLFGGVAKPVERGGRDGVNGLGNPEQDVRARSAPPLRADMPQLGPLNLGPETLRGARWTYAWRGLRSYQASDRRMKRRSIFCTGRAFIG